MLQAGLKAEVEKWYYANSSGNEIDIGNSDPVPEDSIIVFKLIIKDAMVKKESKKRTNDYALPVFCLSLRELYNLYFYYYSFRFIDVDGAADEFPKIINDIMMFVNEHATYFAAVDSLLLLFVVISLIRLIRNQKLSILKPTAFFLSVFAITRFIVQCLNPN